MMKTIVLTLCLLSLSHLCFASNTEKNIAQVERKVEELRVALIDADAKKLKILTAPELNYGHSGGSIENQDEFIEKLTSGKSDFVTIDVRDQKIQIVKDIAIVRHTLVATTNSNGKPGETTIGVMLIWQKQHGDWKLLARQAFKTH